MGSIARVWSTAVGLTLFCSAFAAQPAEIAVTARYYFPYPDKRHSYHQVYVVRDDGSKPRQLTFDKGDKEFVRWAGRNRVAFIARHGKRCELWLLDVRGRSKRLVARAKEIWSPAFCGEVKPGQPLYIVGKTPRVLRHGRLHATSRTAEPPYVKLPLTIKGRRGLATFTLSTRPAEQGHGTPTLVVTSHGKEHPLPKLSEPTNVFLGVLYDRRSHRAWAHVVAGESTYGHPDILYALGPEAPYAAVVASGVCLDWCPGRDGYAYIPIRHDAEYGPKQTVWTSEAGVGSIGSKAKKALVKGFVYVTSVSMRPRKGM